MKINGRDNKTDKKNKTDKTDKRNKIKLTIIKIIFMKINPFDKISFCRWLKARDPFITQFTKNQMHHKILCV